jgi:NAD(P)-dependent dehydrogenase (short-subunit alcohol dehydrogenase family)
LKAKSRSLRARAKGSAAPPHVRLAQEGAKVVVADQIEETAQRVCKEISRIRRIGDSVCGRSQRTERRASVDEMRQDTYGKIDALANIVGG